MLASSVSMMDSTSSIAMRMFSGLRSATEASERGGVREERSVFTGVYDAAAAVHVVQAEQDLLADLLDKVHGDALVLMAFDKAEEVLAEDLEDHADMDAVGALVAEVVEEGDDMGAAGVGDGGGRRGVGEVGRGLDGGRGGDDEALEELDLVERGLGVAGRGLDDLERNMAVHSGTDISTSAST